MPGEWGLTYIREHLASAEASIAGLLAGGGPTTWGLIGGTLANQTDLQSALNGKQVAGSYAAASHGHIIADVTGLQAALDGKQASGSYQPLATVLTNTTASFTAALETKLNGIATGATANSTDAFLLARANHTGTQAAGTITGLSSVATSGSAADLSVGNLSVSRLGGGTGASSSTFWRGDGTWVTPTAGSGTVTTVSVVTANGVSGSVATPTTTPAITLSLGAITPSSVAASGTVTGSNLSGTNTGNQTTIVGITGTLAEFNTALTGVDFATGGGTATGTNTGDQTSVSGNAGTATALAAGRTLGITGDLAWTSPAFDGSVNVTAAGTLATVNTNVGTFGSSSLVPVVTVNAKGLVTAVTTAAVGGGGVGGLATISLATARYEHTETVAATGVTGSSRVIVGLAPSTDSDENCAEMLDMDTCVAEAGTATITITATFSQPTQGAIKFNWSAL